MGMSAHVFDLFVHFVYYKDSPNAGGRMFSKKDTKSTKLVFPPSSKKSGPNLSQIEPYRDPARTGFSKGVSHIRFPMVRTLEV